MQPPEAGGKRQAEVTTPRAHNSSEPEVEMGIGNEKLFCLRAQQHNADKKKKRMLEKRHNKIRKNT